ncbi:unnamed protein product [Parajaminaea phylloscopi]
MPRKFLDVILNRPSQSYAPEPPQRDRPAGPSIQASQRQGQWTSPTDLPNAAAGPSSLLAPSASLRDGKGPPSTFTAASSKTVKSRFGRNKKASRPPLAGNTFDDGVSSIAESSATVSKPKRWWDAGSLRGFGRGSRSRAGSIAGESIFSEPAERPLAGVAGVGSANGPVLRGSRSDIGGPTARRPQAAAPPLPQHDAAALRAMNAAAQRSQNVAPLGQRAPSLNRHLPERRSSKSDLRSSDSMLLTPSTAPKRASTISKGVPSSAVSASSSDWNDFTRSMSSREVAKAWTHTPAAQSEPQRRKSVVTRVQKELEQDAQFEQVVRDPGIVRGDLLARAANAVVGAPFEGQQGGPDAATAQLPVDQSMPQDIRPGSVILSPQHAHTTEPFKDTSTVADTAAAPNSNSLGVQSYSPPAMNSHAETAAILPGRRSQESAIAPAADITTPVSTRPNTSTTDSATTDDDEAEEGESETNSETSSDDSDASSEELGRQQLDVVAEEDEDGSSNGHHEMRSAPRASFSHRSPPARYLALQAAYMSGPPKERGTEGFSSSPRVQAAQLAPSTKVDAMSEASTSHSPPLPPKDNTVSLPPSAAADLPEVAKKHEGGGSADNAGRSQDSVYTPAAEKLSADDSSDTESGSLFTDSESQTDEESGKDGEEAPPSHSGVQEHIPVLQESSAAHVSPADTSEVKSNLQQQQEQSAPKSLPDDEKTPESRQSSEVDDDSSSESASGAEAGAEDGDSDEAAETVTVGSDTTGKRSAGRSSRSRPASTLQRRLSDVSLGNSFAFSHFMGSRMSGRSSSRRIKLRDTDRSSNSEGDASEDDEELRKLALAEQERLRKMNVGDDFFGGSFSDVLAKLSEFDAAKPSVEFGTAAAQTPQDSTKSAEQIQRVYAAAEEIVGEIRRRRAAGDTDADHKTLQSEAGDTLAASLAAVWLMEQDQETQRQAGGSEVASPLSQEKPSSMGSQATSSEPSAKRQSVLNRPRFKSRKPKEMAGIPISEGRLAAEERKTAEDERSTLSLTPSTSWGSRFSQSVGSPQASPEKPRRQSFTLGDQKKSKDKPAPVKSALKSRSLRQSKSLADTLLNFSPKKAESKRARAVSIKSKASSKAEPAAADVKATEPTHSVPLAESHRVDSQAAQDGMLGLQPNAVPLESPSSLSPVKVPGDPISPSTAHDALPHPAVPTATSQPMHPDVKGKGKARADETSLDGQATVSNRDRSESNAIIASRSQPNAHNLAIDADEQGREKDTIHEQGLRSSPPSSEMWSERSGVSTALTSPSIAGVASDVKATSPSHQHAAQTQGDVDLRQDGCISLPPPPTFDAKVTPNASLGPNGDRTPLAVPRPEPAFGMNVIPPTPPATSDASRPVLLKRSMSASSSTPTAEKPAMFRDAMGPSIQQQPSAVSSKSSANPESVPGRKSSKKRTSMLEDAHAHGLSLPPGMTATTIATSSTSNGSRRRKKSSKSATSAGQKNPEASDPVATAPQEPQVSDSPTAPPRLPPKELAVPSRVYAAPLLPTGSNDRVLASLSPPGSTVSSEHLADRDVSPSRSVTSRASSSNLSSGSGAPGSASNASNSATSSDYPGSFGSGTPSSSQRARVRTQSLGPAANRRGSAMAAIDEWASSSPVADTSHSPRFEAMTLEDQSIPSREDYPVGSAAMSSSSIRSGVSPSIVRNAPIGSATETYLGLPVPRSRLSVDDRARQHFEAQLAASSAPSSPYAQSLDGHESHSALQRSGSVVSAAHSYAGHERSGAASQNGHYPASMASGLSSYSDAQSLSSLPAIPRSTYRPRDPMKAAVSSTVDDRLYERSTMATVSVTSGAFRKEAKTVKRRSSSEVVGSSAPRRASLDHVPEHLRDELGQTTMNLTAHTPPPRKVGSSQVLVQIIAVAIDEMDRMLLREKVRSETAYGWVPGRSFSGRIMEVGWEVKRLRKGDVVFGLQSNRKCGALAEFMTIDQHLVTKAPEDCLTVEQIAALPSAGVLAHQVMQNHCANLPKGARILVLNAHDGIGLLTMQECAALGPVIVAHCPASVSDGVAVCEANGAHEVVVGEALWAMNTLHESSFDLVLDTIGGRRLYDAARRILATNGQFVTCFGDEHNSANPNFRSQMRSIRRTFFKKDKKNIGYEWIGVDSSEDCKEALEMVKAVAESGDICPRLRSVLPFADAPRAFDPVLRGVQEEPGAVVVRVS